MVKTMRRSTSIGQLWQEGGILRPGLGCRALQDFVGMVSARWERRISSSLTHLQNTTEPSEGGQGRRPIDISPDYILMTNPSCCRANVSSELTGELVCTPESAYWVRPHDSSHRVPEASLIAAAHDSHKRDGSTKTSAKFCVGKVLGRGRHLQEASPQLYGTAAMVGAFQLHEDAVGFNNTQLLFNGEARPQQQVLPPLVPVHPVPQWTGIGPESAKVAYPSFRRTLHIHGFLLLRVLSAKLNPLLNSLSLEVRTTKYEMAMIMHD